MVQGQVAHPLELNLQEKGGVEVAVQLDSILVPGAGGKTQVRTSLIDITARKQAEEALKVLKNDYQTLFHAAADAAFINDLEGRLLEVNEEAWRCLGYTRKELLHLTVSDVTSPDLCRPAASNPGTTPAPKATFCLRRNSSPGTGGLSPYECSSRMIDLQGRDHGAVHRPGYQRAPGGRRRGCGTAKPGSGNCSTT